MQKIPYLTLISSGCSWVSVKRGRCKFGDVEPRGCPLLKRGALVDMQLVPKLKESVPPLQGPRGGW